jgi:hypothetical protein
VNGCRGFRVLFLQVHQFGLVVVKHSILSEEDQGVS